MCFLLIWFLCIYMQHLIRYEKITHKKYSLTFKNDKQSESITLKITIYGNLPSLYYLLEVAIS